MLENGNGGAVETAHKTGNNQNNGFGDETKSALAFISDLTKKVKNKNILDELSWFINLPSPIRGILSRAKDLSPLLHPKFQYIRKERLTIKDNYRHDSQIKSFRQRMEWYLELKNDSEAAMFNDGYLKNLNMASAGEQYDVIFFRTIKSASIGDINELNQMYEGTNLGVQGLTLSYLGGGITIPDGYLVCFNDTGKDYRIVSFLKQPFDAPPLDPLCAEIYPPRFDKQKGIEIIKNISQFYVPIFVKVK